MKRKNPWNIPKNWKPYSVTDEEIDESYRKGECSFTSKQLNDAIEKVFKKHSQNG